MKIVPLVWRLLFVLTLVGLLAGCGSPTATETPTAAPTKAATAVPTTAPTLAPTVDLQPTFNAIKTQSAATVIANLTQTAPSATPVPSATATKPAQQTAAPTTSAATNTPAPKATNTSAPILTPWTVVPTRAAYSCAVTSFSPKATESFAPSSNFDVTWVVMNTGTQQWPSSETVLRFVEGQKMQKFGDAVLLPKIVSPGETYTFGIDMVAPAAAGNYYMNWRLTYGSVTLCNMTVTIVIK